MKIQCSCGAKYEFAIAPAMVHNPVRFVCPACGGDASEFVDSLVRRELGQTASPSGVPQPVVPTASYPPSSAAGAPPAPAPAAPVRLAVPVAHAASAPAPEAQGDAPAAEFPPCPKHPGQFAAEKCCVCSKPICPKCMELFGYVCSPLCRAKADARGITIPVFAGQKSVVEARHWRKVGLVSGSITAFLLLVLGTWFWYAWFGSTPHPVFSVRFPEAAYSGQSFITQKDQIVFLHGGTLARHDMKHKQAVWSRELLDAKQLDAEAAALLKQMEEDYGRTSAGSFKLRPPPLEKLRARVERSAAAALELFVHDRSVWVASPGKLVRYDWETGNPDKELPLRRGFGRLTARGDELLAFDYGGGDPTVTHINLNTCNVQTEEPGRPARPLAAQGGNLTNVPGGRAGGTGSRELAGLPTVPGQDAGKPMDPAKVAEQAQRLSYPARIALPATLAASMNQERVMEELNSEEDRPAATSGARPAAEPERALLISGPDGFVQFSTRLLESRITERSAMKAPPKKSALDNLSVANTLDAANEILNEMQRNRGGDLVQEDESRYRVTIRRPGQAESWSGEVVGPPSLYPLQTVNVLTANKSIVVLDKNCKKLWQSSLSFNVRGGLGALEAGSATTGQGPCVEHGNSLYVYDEGVLTAFDLANGNARWRVPSVGITGLFLDDRDMLYVNSSTAGPESLKYSRQIDVTQKPGTVVFKVDSKDGRVLWSVEPGGPINYLSGKFIYTVSFYQPEETDTDNPYSVESNRPASLRIRRISPKNGRIVWEHGQERAPLDVQFDQNTIRLVFKKEVQVLRFLSF